MLAHAQGEKRARFGEANARYEKNPTAGDFDYVDIDQRRVEFPSQLYKPQRQVVRGQGDPYAHLGPVGYTRNTYAFHGADKETQNIWEGQHMSKTLWLEEMRRLCIAEKDGISSSVDDQSVAHTMDAYLTRSTKNKYIKRPL